MRSTSCASASTNWASPSPRSRTSRPRQSRSRSACPNVQDTARAESEVGTTAQLYFYDWEANALTPNGKTVAEQLQTQDTQATTVSQGTSFAAPGTPNAGSMSLYDAVKLASKQPKHASGNNARLGPQYFMFGAPGEVPPARRRPSMRGRPRRPVSTACSSPAPTTRLYPGTLHATAVKNLQQQLPPGVDASEGEVLVVQQGTVVLQALQNHCRRPPGQALEPVGPVFRAQGQRRRCAARTSRTRRRRPTRGATPTSSSGSIPPGTTRSRTSPVRSRTAARTSAPSGRRSTSTSPSRLTPSC